MYFTVIIHGFLASFKVEGQRLQFLGAEPAAPEDYLVPDWDPANHKGAPRVDVRID